MGYTVRLGITLNVNILGVKQPDPAGLETYVTIRPAVDFATLDIVLVVLSTGVA